ncbi:MAG: flagellar motor switch protein FliM [Syntrophaceticus sp.]
MGEILSQNEIDSLLKALVSGKVTAEELKEGEQAKRIRNYDFRRPNKFSKEQINTLEMIYDNYASSVSTFLSGLLRIIVQISLLSVEQLTYEEFIRSLPDPSVILIFNMEPLEGNGILEIKTPLALSLIDLLLGGRGDLNIESRSLTEIERTIMWRIGQQMLDTSQEVWTNILDFRPKIEVIETNPQFAQIVSPTEMVILISLETKIGKNDGIISYCFPYLALEPVLDKLSAQYWFNRDAGEVKHEQQHFLKEQLLSAKLPLKVVLGSSVITVRDLLEIQVGDVVPIDRSVNEDFMVYIGNNPKFAAKPGVSRNRLAIQITDFLENGGSYCE